MGAHWRRYAVGVAATIGLDQDWRVVIVVGQGWPLSQLSLGEVNAGDVIAIG